MHDAGDLVDPFLINAMGARVSDHQTGQVILVLPGFFAQVRHVDIAILVALDQYDLHAAHRCAGRIGAVRRGRYQRNVAVHITARMMIGLYYQQSGILALCAAVRLEAHLGEPCDLAKRFVQTGYDFQVTCRLIEWNKGVDVGEFRPSQRDQLRSGVQLHRA